MADHREYEELLAAYALDALDPAELESVRVHLDECPVCQAEAEILRRTAGSLALVLSPVAPAPALRSRLLEAARRSVNLDGAAAPTNGAATGVDGAGDPALAPPRLQLLTTAERELPASVAGSREIPRSRLGVHLRWALVFAAVLLVALGWTFTLQRQLDEQTRLAARLQTELAEKERALALLSSPSLVHMDLAGDQSPRASGRLFCNASSTRGILVVDNLPALSSSQVYQAWLRRGESRVSGGVFSVDREGYGHLVINAPEPIGQFQAVGVTVEPAGGSPAPTGNRVLAGAIDYGY
ncbi:MAG: anti-sigma factor [Chloroflexi bacterium]|nr:anti-sigma factor [Chloroflexota bacterium]